MTYHSPGDSESAGNAVQRNAGRRSSRSIRRRAEPELNRLAGGKIAVVRSIVEHHRAWPATNRRNVECAVDCLIEPSDGHAPSGEARTLICNADPRLRTG
jgi:hypothetical protein